MSASNFIMPGVYVDSFVTVRLGITNSASRILQKIHFLCSLHTNERDGKFWTYQTISQWKNEHFPDECERTIANSIAQLQRMNLIHVANYNTRKGDKTKWYSVNYEELKKYSVVVHGFYLILEESLRKLKDKAEKKLAQKVKDTVTNKVSNIISSTRKYFTSSDKDAGNNFQSQKALQENSSAATGKNCMTVTNITNTNISRTNNINSNISTNKVTADVTVTSDNVVVSDKNFKKKDTANYAEATTNGEILNLVKELGISLSTVLKYVKAYNEKYVIEKLKLLSSAIRRTEIHSPIAWLISALKKNYVSSVPNYYHNNKQTTGNANAEPPKEKKGNFWDFYDPNKELFHEGKEEGSLSRRAIFHAEFLIRTKAQTKMFKDIEEAKKEFDRMYEEGYKIVQKEDQKFWAIIERDKPSVAHD